MTAFPQYDHEESTQQARVYVLGAAPRWNAAHAALLVDDKRKALEEIEACLDLVIKAHRELLASGVPAREPVAETTELALTTPPNESHGTL